MPGCISRELRHGRPGVGAGREGWGLGTPFALGGRTKGIKEEETPVWGVGKDSGENDLEHSEHPLSAGWWPDRGRARRGQRTARQAGFRSGNRIGIVWGTGSGGLEQGEPFGFKGSKAGRRESPVGKR